MSTVMEVRGMHYLITEDTLSIFEWTGKSLGMSWMLYTQGKLEYIPKETGKYHLQTLINQHRHHTSGTVRLVLKPYTGVLLYLAGVLQPQHLLSAHETDNAIKLTLWLTDQLREVIITPQAAKYAAIECIDVKKKTA